jgi:RNA polymerase sigma-70 factor, ECF subfamily
MVSVALVPQPEVSDEELFGRFRDRRDVEALGRLYDRYEAALVSFASRMLGGPAGHADDVLQETWIRAMQHAREWSPEAPLRAWLFRIARNLCLDTLRSRGVALDAALDPRLAADPLPSGFTYPMHDPLFVEIMERAVLTLPPAQREVVLLRVEGLSFGEISRVTQVGLNTLKSRMNQARKTLGVVLAERGYDGH